MAGGSPVTTNSRELTGKKIFTKFFIYGLILGDDSLAKPRRNLVDLFHCFRRNTAITDVDQRFHFAQSILDLMNDWKVKLRHCLESFLKIREKVRLVQQLGTVTRKMVVHD